MVEKSVEKYEAVLEYFEVRRSDTEADSKIDCFLLPGLSLTSHYNMYIYTGGASPRRADARAAPRMPVMSKKGIIIGKPNPHKSNRTAKACTVKHVHSI